MVVYTGVQSGEGVGGRPCQESVLLGRGPTGLAGDLDMEVLENGASRGIPYGSVGGERPGGSLGRWARAETDLEGKPRTLRTSELRCEGLGENSGHLFIEQIFIEHLPYSTERTTRPRSASRECSF